MINAIGKEHKAMDDYFPLKVDSISWVCHICGQEFPDAESMEAHLNQHALYRTDEVQEAIQEMVNGDKPVEVSKDDNVNHPSHYTQGKIETIDYIRDVLTPEGFQGYCLGNLLKYVSRYRFKNGLEDLRKGAVYLNWGIESMAENEK